MEKELEWTFLKRCEEAKALEKGKRKKKKKIMKATTIKGALTISLYILFLFSYTLLTVQLHHIIYVEMREMAGTMLYIHVVVPINITGLSHAVHQFHEKVQLL
jgi:hypothetical protein